MAFLDIDVSPHPALYDPEGLTRRFKTIGAPRVVRSVTLQDEDDDLVGTFALAALADGGVASAEPVHAVEVEDSSEGVALLIFGGEGGLSLRDQSGTEIRREACLLLAPGTVAT
jgi:hypothetical protein